MSNDEYKGNKHIPNQVNLDGEIAATTPSEPVVVPDEKHEGEFKVNQDALDENKDAKDGAKDAKAKDDRSANTNAK